jgi:hypothetical protein
MVLVLKDERQQRKHLSKAGLLAEISTTNFPRTKQVYQPLDSHIAFHGCLRQYGARAHTFVTDIAAKLMNITYTATDTGISPSLISR